MAIFIYKITCTKNNKVYIGQTKDVKKRKTDHINSLKNGKHHSAKMQRAFDKYGESSFEHRILEIVPENIADERERYWIKHYNSTDKLYGFNNESGGNAKKMVSNETKEKLRRINKINYHKVKKYLNSEEAIKKKSSKMTGSGNPMYGKTPKEWMDKETYDNWIAGKRKRLLENNPMKGKKHTAEAIEKIRKASTGANNPFYGKHHSNEFKNKLSKHRKENPTNFRKIICVTTNEIFNTITEASIKFNVDGSGISKCCRGKIKRCGKLSDGTPLIFRYL